MNTSPTPLGVLVIEDNDGDARLIHEALRDLPATPITLHRAITLQAGLEFLGRNLPDAVLVDLNLPDSQGLDTLRKVCALAPHTPVIVLTGLNDESMAVTALREGAQDYLSKGELDARLLLRAIRYAMERKENEALLRDVQSRLVQAQRMEAVGRLAGGIAHDFNNLLTVIQGYARLLQDSQPPESDTHRDLAAIATAADRAASLTQQLLAYSRKQVMQLRVIDLGSLVQTIEPQLRHTLRDNITLTITLAPDLGQVEADPGQIEQVVSNLTANARDAMPAGGSVMIACANVTVSDDWASRHPELRSGEYVQFSVTDTGIGMPASVVQHVFDPFFTTKPFGQGTGLGLATVYGIVKQHHGHIWVYSEPGQGTTMTVVLPRVNQAITLAPEPTAPATRGSETLLLVEDDPETLTMLRISLKNLGYTVLTAQTAHAALQLMRHHENTVSLLVSDIVLPDLSGPELYEGLRGGRPDLKALFMSAYPGEAILQRGMITSGTPFISKPFTAAALAQRIRDVLGNQSTH